MKLFSKKQASSPLSDNTIRCSRRAFLIGFWRLEQWIQTSFTSSGGVHCSHAAVVLVFHTNRFCEMCNRHFLTYSCSWDLEWQGGHITVNGVQKEMLWKQRKPHRKTLTKPHKYVAYLFCLFAFFMFWRFSLNACASCFQACSMQFQDSPTGVV